MNKTEPVAAADRDGLNVVLLYMDDREIVRMEGWDKGAKVTMDLPQRGEFLVLDGEDTLCKHSWLRVLEGVRLDAVAKADNTKVWMKLHHIPHSKPPAA